MKNRKALLSSLVKTAQLSQVGIRSMMDIRMRPALRKALEKQLHELDAIETEACCMASRRGWELPELDPALRIFTNLSVRIRLSRQTSDSQIAGILIQDNTRDLIRGIRQSRQLTTKDEPLQILTQKLLDCETAGIRQMQNFL